MTESTLGFPAETVAVFIALSVGALALDLFMHRADRAISLRSALLWSLFWIAVALGFGLFLYVHHGVETASLFLTGYALEKVLSVDNLFVIMAIFIWFSVPDNLRHRVLYWGIMGAIVFRGIFVALGTGLLHLGPWMEMVFAAAVAWTGVMMLKRKPQDEQEIDYSQHLAVRATRRIMPLWPRLHGHSFIVTGRQARRLLAQPENQGLAGQVTPGAWAYATPLLLCLAVIELSDVMFAFDSVPAVIAVSREPLIVYSAMMFAILGLRTLYFVLEALKGYLVHLEKAVIVLLFFIAAKLALNASDHLFHHGYALSALASLWVVLGVLAAGIVASLIFPERAAPER
ncbi:tellurium resistance protein TerC [Salmonella enterica subsp. enterica serovar Choleraesuis]|nr:tellurium resistance protein TerC [Salmonella enterica subsp. enterica serovar Choleraesuis]